MMVFHQESAAMFGDNSGFSEGFATAVKRMHYKGKESGRNNLLKLALSLKLANQHEERVRPCV